MSDMDRVLRAAARTAGLDSFNVELIRDGSHAMYKLGRNIVARVGSPGTDSAAVREVQVSRWLAEHGMSVTQAIPDIPQPVVIDGRPVTWWDLLPEHRAATPAELGSVLRELHNITDVPREFDLPEFEPFAGLDHRLRDIRGLDADDRAWLVAQLAELRGRYDQLGASGSSNRIIHGDAWQGNVAVLASGRPVLLDLESVSLGRPDWDLVPLAVDYTDFARLSDRGYDSFVRAYGGHDVRNSPEFRTLADIREFRWVCFVVSKLNVRADAEKEAHHRIACLRGEIPRPWSWTAF